MEYTEIWIKPTKEKIEQYILECFEKYLKKLNLDEDDIKYILKHTKVKITEEKNGNTRTEY